MSKQKRYFLEGDIVTDSSDGEGGWIVYTKQSDGNIVCSSSDPERTFWENPVTGKEADELWDSLVDRATNPENQYYYDGPY